MKISGYHYGSKFKSDETFDIKIHSIKHSSININNYRQKMVSIFRTRILLFVAFFMQSSLQNKINDNNNDIRDKSTSNLVNRDLNNNKRNKDFNLDKSALNGLINIPPVADGGNGQICYTKNEVRIREIQFGGQPFKIPYYIIVRYCNQF